MGHHHHHSPTHSSQTLNSFLKLFSLPCNHQVWLREDFKIKKRKKSDIVIIRVSTHPTPTISDIKFSDISSQCLDPPYPMISMMKSSNNVSNREDRVSGFKIKPFKPLNPLTLMVKLLHLTLIGVKMFINS